MTTSHRRILNSSIIVGSAALVNVVLGLVRMKGAALLVGPSGVGLISLLLNLVTLAATIAALGFGASAVREIAAAQAAGDIQKRDASRRALFWCTVAGAVLSSALLWLLAKPLAVFAFGGSLPASEIASVAPAVGFTVAAAACVTLLNGFRRIADIARVQVIGALAGTATGLAALAIGREQGLVWYVALAPISALLIGLVFVRSVPPLTASWELRSTVRQGQVLARLGLPFMAATLSSTIAVLLVRTLLLDHRGASELGLFAATWTISTTYVSFILQAMSTDYFPHLSAIIEDRTAANRLINDQIEVSVLLALPVLLFTVACAPWVLHIAYSGAFSAAADLLRWQVAGDIFKIFSWPLTMSMLAAGRGKTFLATETGASFFYTAAVFLLIDRLGLLAAGVAYVLMYAGHCSVLLVLTRRAHGFRMNGALSTRALIAGAVLAAVTAAALWSDTLGLFLGLPATLVAGLLSLRRLQQLNALPSRILAVLDAFGSRRVRGISAP